MSCYFRHLKDIIEGSGIEITPANKKQIDQTFHKIVGVVYKDCPTTWKALKQTILSDEKKRHELIKKLQTAIQ